MGLADLALRGALADYYRHFPDELSGRLDSSFFFAMLRLSR